MSILVDSIEGRLQLRLGQLLVENEVLRQCVADLERKLQDAQASGSAPENTDDND